MLKHCNNAELEVHHIDAKYYLLYQLWKELTEKKTLATYQFRIMNTLSAIHELIDVIELRLKRYHRGTHNIEYCKNETIDIVKNDLILQEHYLIIKNRLLSHLCEKSETDAQQRVLLHQLKNTLIFLEPGYFEKSIDSLKQSIEDGIDKEIICKTNQLVSCCSENGWSNEALFKVIETLKGSALNPNLWDTFKSKLCNANDDEYHILLPFKIRAYHAHRQKNESAKKNVLEEIGQMGMEVVTKTEILYKYPYLDEKSIEANQVYLLKSVKSHDAYSASQLAISMISNILNMLSFYNLTEPWSIRDISWFVINTANKYTIQLKSKDLYSTYDYLEGAYKIFQNSKILDNEDECNVKNRLRATYSYANMGKASYAQTEKYMNTWVALESLCRTEMYDNIIDNILETVPAALCLRYIYQCYRNFIEDCIRCGIIFDFSSTSICVKYSPKEKIVSSIIAILKDETTYQELLDKCSVNTLLTIRCIEMHDLAADPYKMFSKIDRHYITVKRHLSRLYRIRNEIAHSALNDGTSLMRYIEHLDDYLVNFVAEVVMCWTHHRKCNIEGIFEIIKDNYREYLAIRSSKKGTNPVLLLEGLLNSGIIALMP